MKPKSPVSLQDFVLPNTLAHKEAESCGKSACSENSLSRVRELNERQHDEEELVGDADSAGQWSARSDSEKSLCDYLPPQVRALNASRYLNELWLAESPSAAIQSPRVPSLNEHLHALRHEQETREEEQRNDACEESESEPSLCDFLSPRARALNDRYFGSRQEGEMAAVLDSRGPECPIEDDDVASEASLCDFLSPRVRALNDQYFGGLLEDASLCRSERSSAPPSFGDSSLPLRASSCNSDRFRKCTKSSCDQDSELRANTGDKGIKSEVSLCDFLPPRVVALNGGSVHGSVLMEEPDVGVVSFAKEKVQTSRNNWLPLGEDESTTRCIDEHRRDLETNSSGSEASLCDDVPYVAVAPTRFHVDNLAEASSYRGPSTFTVRPSSAGRQHLRDELRLQQLPYGGSSGYPQATVSLAIPDDVIVDGSNGEKSDTSGYDYQFSGTLPFNGSHGEYPSDHSMLGDDSRTNGATHSNPSLCNFLPPHDLTLNETHRATEADASLFPEGVDTDNDRMPARRWARQRSESSLVRALRGVRETLVFRSWRRRSTLPANINRSNMDRSDISDANDREVLNLPDSLPADRTPTTTISVETFRKEILYPQRVRSRTTVQTFSCSGQDADDKQNDESCAVCLEPFSQGDVLRRFPCGHRFHTVCIDGWLVENRLCPMCRHDPLALTSP